MNIDAYFNPDFTLIKKLIFLLMTLAGVMLCTFLIFVVTKLVSKPDKERPTRQEKDMLFFQDFHTNIQLFFEMMISGTSVMLFACSYVIINHVYDLVSGGKYVGFNTFVSVWEEWKDFILLLLICLSCVANTLIDKFIIPLKKVTREQKASMRVLGMFYVIIILLYLNRIGEKSAYGPVMMYYLGLMVGRFVYFDASFLDFLQILKSALRHAPIFIMCILLSGSLSYIGFSLGYFIEHNYFIMGIFYTHLFILAVIFILHLSRIMYLFARKPKIEEYPDEYEEEYEEEYDDYDEYDDYEK